jgi:hypothetical protein
MLTVHNASVSFGHNPDSSVFLQSAVHVIYSHFLPHREHAIKLCTAIISIYCNNHTKYINVLCSKMEIANPKAYQHLLKRQTLHSFISRERSEEPWSSITTIDSFITCELPTAADLVPRSLLRVVLDSMQQNTLLDVKSRCQQTNIPPPNPTLHGTRSFINIFIRSCHRSLLRARSIHSTHYLSLCDSNIIIHL